MNEFIFINMATNEDLEKRIETLEKEVKHLKAVLLYQMRNKKKSFLFHSNYFCLDKHFLLVVLGT